jgi:Skp family chaperone for outer membrane proteins
MRVKHLLLSLVPFVFCAAVQADVRIATVDVSKILNDSPEAVAKKKELDTLSEETKKKLESKAKDLQALKTKLENSKVSAESKEAESFRNQARDFERMRGDAKADLEKKYMKVNKELTDKVLARIAAYAKSNDYDLVFEKSERFRGPVLFGSDSVDITDQILKNSR